MFVGIFARGDRGPQNRREHRGETGDVAHHPVVDEFFQVGHMPLLNEGLDHLPVGSVPADE